MIDQPMIFPMTKEERRAESRRNRDKAMLKVAQNAPAGWNSMARSAVIKVARERGDLGFTTDDVWQAGLPKPPSPRALGPVMLSMAKLKLIEPTGQFITTSQATRNGAPVRVWRLVR